MKFAARTAVAVIATTTLVVLSGCSAFDQAAHPPAATDTATDTAAVTTTATPPPPREKPERVVTPRAPRSKPIIARTQTQSGPQSEPRPEMREAALTDGLAAVPTDDPDWLIGLEPSQVTAVLGGPVSVLERSPSMVWRYKSTGCDFDLFFYLDLGSNTFRVLAYDLKSGKASERAARACLAHYRAIANAR